MSPIRPILILVVDDEPYLADLAKSFLTESEGLEVETAYSVSDARTILAKRHFDAIISDYQMPREDGLQFLKSLRQSGDNIPFVLFTGRGREEVVIEALNNGADSYLQKGGLPVPAYTELEHRVRKAVQRHRAEMALVKSAVDLREAQEIAHMGRWERDLVSGQIEWSDGLFTIFEVDPDTFPPAHDSSLNFTHPEDRAIVEKAYGESAEKRKPYDFEHRLLLRDGSIKWVSEIGRTLYDDAGGPIRSVGTIQDITERKQNEAALKDASYAQRLIGASLDPLLAIDAEGVITEANAATSKLTGVSHEELIGADLSRYFTDPLKAKEGYLKVFKEGEVRDYPATLLGPSGRRVDVTYSASVYRDEYGRIKGVLVAIHDVTERKVAQDALKETEARFDQLAEQSGTVTWEADQEGLFTYVSSVSEIAWGYHPDELMGQMHFYDLVVEAERETIKSRVFEMAKHGERFVGIEHAVRTKDGRTRWNSTSGIPLLKADGSIRGYQGSDTDVSERKVVEEELLKISQRLSLATRAGGVGIWDLDVINNKLIWDDQMFKLYGIEEAHFGGAYEAWKAGLFPEDAQRGDEEIQMALRDEKEFDTEFRVLWPNRTVHHIRALAVVQRDASGKPLRMMGTNWDITDLRRAEKINLDKERSLRNEAEEQLTRYPKPSPELMEQKKMILIHELQVHQVELEMQAQELRKAQNAVEESRDKYLDLYEFAPLGYLTLTDKAQVEGANITSAALLGIDRGKLVGARFSKFLAEEEADKWHLYFRNVLRHREKQICTLTLRRGDGSTFPARLESIQVSDSSEGRATVRVAISDVTDIEETRELRASEARFDQLAVQSGTVTWEADADGLFTYVSSVSEIVWGYHPHELVGKVHFYDLVIEAEREAIKSRVFEIAKHGEGFVGLEHAVHCKDGSVRWNSTSGIPLLKADGSIRGYQGSDTDVSERKVVEEELLKISQRLSLATRAGGVGIWDLDVINNKLIWDDQMFKLYGIEEAHFGGAYEAWKAGLFPEDAQRGDEEIQMALRDEKEFDTEFRVLWPNRTVHHIRALAVVQRDASGKPLRMMGTNWDITERKHAEETLRNASIKLGILNSITRHDITNQMLALTGFLELCKRREKDPRSMEYLEKMTRATENVQRQIAFTKEYQDIGVKAPAWVSPGRQTAEAFAMLHPEGVELEDRTEGVEVMADPLAEKVPYNLIDNSMRHGEHVTRIKMSAEQKDDALLIVYEDDGVGISAEDKKRLFEKGFGKNTGFGLFLTREILAITGITITETGKEGEGVRFELLVPAGAWQLRSE